MPQQPCILFEDAFTDRLRPINLARPTHKVTCGAYCLGDLVADAGWRAQYYVRPHLRAVVDVGGANLADAVPGPVLYLNAALVPDLATLARIGKLVERGSPFVALTNQRVTAALCPADFTPSLVAGGRDLTTYLLEQRLSVVDDEFVTFEHSFEVVKHHERLLPGHLARLIEKGSLRSIDRNVYVGRNPDIASNVVFDASEGPIILGDDVRIRPFSYIAGPVKVGDRSLIIDHASIKHGTVLGHTVKAGGEIEVSVVEPYSNKQHHGFLGHAYVGSWVNLGAGTSNSDLKNTYGEVGVEIDGKNVNTGMQFVGCVIGDFTKTAINTSIFTGKLIGVGSFVYGFVSTNVPSFTNYARSFGQVTEVSADVAIKTQTRAAGRRKVAVGPIEVALMQDLFELTRSERQLSSEQIVL